MSLRDSMKLMDKASSMIRKEEEIDKQVLQSYLQDNNVTSGEISTNHFFSKADRGECLL